jgi:hypothetical protein
MNGEDLGDDDSNSRELEQLLRQTPLRPPPAGLDRRVGAALHPWRRRARALGVAAAAAAIALGLGSWAVRRHPHGAVSEARLPSPSRPAPAAAVPPVSIVRTYGGVSSDGVVGVTADGRPVQRVRRQIVRQVQVIDPQRGTKLSISVPQEVVYLVPVKAF